MPKENKYPCPREHKGRPIVIETLRGWKKHMSYAHKGYTEQELEAVMTQARGQTPAAEGKGRDQFLSEAEAGPPKSETEQPPDGEVGRGAAQTLHDMGEPTKRIPFKSRKLKKFLSNIPEIFLRSKGITPDDDDKDLMDGATELLEEMFGISFEIPETMWVIRSRFVAVVFPLAAMLLVWAKHQFGIQLGLGGKHAEQSGGSDSPDGERKDNKNSGAV